MTDELVEAVAEAVRVHCHAMTYPKDAARAALAAIEASGTHVVVPTTITQPMLLAAEDDHETWVTQESWAAMLSARPKQEDSK